MTSRVTKEATCTSKGVRTFTCRYIDCDYSYTRDIPATGHNFADATCTEASKCTKCGAKTGSPLGHSYGSWITDSFATCSKEGVKHRECSRCGYHDSFLTPSTGHNYSAATCTEPRKCSKCGGTSGSALGHSYGSWTTDSFATCTSEGTKHRECSRCGHHDSLLTPATGHSYSAATCTEPRRCTKCGDISGSSLGHDYSKATCYALSECSRCGRTKGSFAAHSWGSWRVDTYASCTRDGSKHRECSVCGKTEYETIYSSGHDYTAATCTTKATCTKCGDTKGTTLPHSWGEWTIESEPDCITEGAKTRVCSTCSKTEQQSISATGHSWGEWDIDLAVTCLTDGSKHRICDKCLRLEEKRIPAEGHVYDAWMTVTPATCNLDGKRQRKCMNCSEREVEILPATGHAWSYDEELNRTTCDDCKTYRCDTGTHVYDGADHCKECGIFICDAEGHDFSGKILWKDSVGHKIKCTRCSADKSEDHLFVVWIPCTDEMLGPAASIGNADFSVESSHLAYCCICEEYAIEPCAVWENNLCKCTRDMTQKHICSGNITYTENDRMTSMYGHTGHCQDPECPGVLESHHFVAKISGTEPDADISFYVLELSEWVWVECEECSSQDLISNQDFTDLMEKAAQYRAMLARDQLYAFLYLGTCYKSQQLSYYEMEKQYFELCDRYNVERGTAADHALRDYCDIPITDEVDMPGWYNPDGSRNPPPFPGSVKGTEKIVTLKAGTVLGRYGEPNPNSDFVTEAGADASRLSIPPWTDTSTYIEYIVIQDIDGVIMSEVAPWGGSTGGGIQYVLPQPILDLINKYLVRR